MISQATSDHPYVPARHLCWVFGVNLSWHRSRCRPEAAPSPEEATRLRYAIERLCLAFPGSGSRRVAAEMRRDG